MKKSVTTSALKKNYPPVTYTNRARPRKTLDGIPFKVANARQNKADRERGRLISISTDSEHVQQAQELASRMGVTTQEIIIECLRRHLGKTYIALGTEGRTR